MDQLGIPEPRDYSLFDITCAMSINLSYVHPIEYDIAHYPIGLLPLLPSHSSRFMSIPTTKPTNHTQGYYKKCSFANLPYVAHK